MHPQYVLENGVDVAHFKYVHGTPINPIFTRQDYCEPVSYVDFTITFEGDSPPPGRLIIFTFPSEDAAKKWYDDPEHQELSEHRRAGTKLQFLTLVHGLPPRG